MPADYSGFKPVTNDTHYATKINNFIDAVQADMNSKLASADVIVKAIVIKAEDYSVEDSDYTIEIDATISDVTITLPDPATSTGRVLCFTRSDSTAYRAIVGTVFELFTAEEYITLQSNGTAWKRIG